MKTILGLFALAFSAMGANAQVTVGDVQNIATMVTAAYTSMVNITGTAGSHFVISKVAGSTIAAYSKCTSADGKNVFGPTSMTATSPSIVSLPIVSCGEILCSVTLNPTATPAASGVMLGVPAVGVAWQCIAGPGSTTFVAGSITWP